jgi:hypothetical protein
MPRALVVDIRPHRVRDVAIVVVRTAPGGADQHAHCALMNADGSGVTSPGPDGHTHAVDECDVLASAGHTHDLSAQRCERDHDERAWHIAKPPPPRRRPPRPHRHVE